MYILDAFEEVHSAQGNLQITLGYDETSLYISKSPGERNDVAILKRE